MGFRGSDHEKGPLGSRGPFGRLIRIADKNVDGCLDFLDLVQGLFNLLGALGADEIVVYFITRCVEFVQWLSAQITFEDH